MRRTVSEGRESEQPFGEDWVSAAANDNQAGYTGHVEDAATGLTYMQARYYDPIIGRFLSIDPVGFSPGRPSMFNRYAYAANDPVNMMDRDGRDPGDRFRTLDAALFDAIEYINPTSIAENREYAGEVYQDDDGYYVATQPRQGTDRESTVRDVEGRVATYHTHGDYSTTDEDDNVVRTNKWNDTYDSNNFSERDKDNADTRKLPTAVGTPSKVAKKYDPATGKTTILRPPSEDLVPVDPPPPPPPPDEVEKEKGIRQ